MVPWKSCPVSGKRAPEMACGDLRPRVEEWAREAELGVVVACASVAEQADRDAILADFANGVSFVAASLDLKLAIWRVLPWRLAGLAHHEPVAAAACARDCLAQYDANPDAGAHHRLSVRLLAPFSEHRPAVEALAAGRPLADLPGASIIEVLRLKWIPIGERVIESRHGLISRALRGRRRRRAACTVSLGSGRMREFEDAVRANPDVVVAVARHLDTVRNGRAQIEAFGLQDHPLVRAAAAGASRGGRRVHPSRFEPTVRDIIYHLAAVEQYRDRRVSAQAVNEQRLAVARTRLELDRRVAAPAPEGREDVVREAMRAHMLDALCCDGAGARFSIPAVGLSVVALPDLLQCPAGRVPLALPALPLVGPGAAALALAEQLEPDDGEEADGGNIAPAPPAPDASAALCCKVVHARAGHLKLPPVAPAVGRRLRQGEVAISMHPALHTDGPRVMHVLSRPQRLGVAAPSSAGILRFDDVAVDVLAERTLSWERGPQRYYLRGLACAASLMDVVGQLVGARAFEGLEPESVLHLTAAAAEGETGDLLEGLAGDAEPCVRRVRRDLHPSAWQLTRAGAARVELVETWVRPSLFLHRCLTTPRSMSPRSSTSSASWKHGGSSGARCRVGRTSARRSRTGLVSQTPSWCGALAAACPRGFTSVPWPPALRSRPR